MICKLCGSLSILDKTGLCSDCAAKNERAFNTIREYLMKHRSASALNVIQDTGIDSKLVSFFIQQGRFLRQ